MVHTIGRLLVVYGKHVYRRGCGLFYILFFFIGNPGYSQYKPADSLQVDQHITRSTLFMSQGLKDSAIFYANQALELASGTKYFQGMARAYLRKSQIARHFDDDIGQTKKYGQEALRYFDQSNHKEGIDTVYALLFYVVNAECNFDEGMDYSEKYYGEALQKNDQNGIYASLNEMFALNVQLGNYEKSFQYGQQLYDIAVQTGNKIWIANSLWSLGRLYTQIESYPDALNYFRRVREMNEPDIKSDRVRTDQDILYQMEFAEAFSRMKQFDSAEYYYQLSKSGNETYRGLYLVSTGEYFFQQGKFKEALQNFQSGLLANREHQDTKETMRSLLDLASVYLILDNPRDAITYGREGLEMALPARVNQYIRDGYKILSDAFDRLGQSDSSNFYFRKYAVVKDVVLNAQVKGRMAAYNYEQRIETVNKERRMQEIQLQKETLLKNILIGSLVLLTVLAFFIFRNVMLKRKYEARRRELAENELLIQKLESDKSTAELLQQRTELEMKALRAQMNPHFIFNCLNSINQFISSNDSEKAAGYLTKFAKLIRMVLEKSGKPLVALEEELNSLKLYMDLEAIRFERPFEYTIDDHGMDTSAVLIPSLLIQPFVENAIWHGIYPNKERRGLIHIDLKLNNDILHCEISDNGIGMAGSAALKGYSVGNKKSMGMEITNLRLQLSDPLRPEDSGFSIQDIMDDAGRHTGTRVHVNIRVRCY